MYFCFFQQKIEWAHLLERHPDKYREAMQYEKVASENDSPFVWTQRESLTELSRLERITQIKSDYEKR